MSETGANNETPAPDTEQVERKALSPAAERALAEAAARRLREKPVSLPPEKGGRGGAEPSRFGDWEIKGRAIDF